MVIKNWHNFVKTKQVSILDSLLSENIIFYSPVVHSPQKGLNIAKKYLEAASLVLFNSSFKYINETHNTNSAICEFECELNNIYINGIDIIEWENNKITSFKVMVRPLKGILLLKEKMAEILLKA
ncbi:MAG: nuclear transport factor 2 family protein [Pelagibacterales bacterium]|nr:nuclear transport factor 2 family protein [Pelagibacterales bacterium]